MTDKYFIHVKSTGDDSVDEYREIDGERVLEKVFPELDLFVHHVINRFGELPEWVVSEGKSGSALGETEADTKEKAILLALDVVIKMGVSHIITASKRMVTKHGLSPKHVL